MDFKLKGKSFYEKVINILLDILIFLFGLILIVFVYNSVQVKILKNDYSSFFGYSIFEVQTGSMADAINAGDWIVVKYKNNYKLDDIVTYKLNGEFVTHRIVESYENTYITKGDANPSKDEPINKSQVVGKNICVLPYFGALRKTLLNPVVLMFMIITLYLIGFLFNKKTNPSKAIFKIKESVKTEEPSVIKEEVPLVKKIEKYDPNFLVDKENDSVVEENLNDLDDDSLNKTMCFRMVEVDSDDIDSTKIITVDVEEVEEEKDKDKQNIKDKDSINIEEVKFDEDIIVNDNKLRKSKNFIDKVISIKEDEIDDLLELLKANKKKYTNESTIKNKFVSFYMDAKYYNNYLNQIKINNLNKYIDDISEHITNEYKGTDVNYKDKVLLYNGLFKLISGIENIEEKYTAGELFEKYNIILKKYFKEKEYDKDSQKYVIDQIIQIRKTHDNTINTYIEKLNSTTFELLFNKLSTKKNYYGLDLKHNINFSKVYSDYIVDKVYTEGIIAEDKIIILFTLLQIKLISNLLSHNFDEKYIIYIPKSLYLKESKLNRLFKMIDDSFAKSSILILLSYEDLLFNEKIITKARLEGYSFTLFFDKKINSKTKHNIMCLCDYVFVDKDVDETNGNIKFIPKDLSNNIIYENIIDKVGSTGGE